MTPPVFVLPPDDLAHAVVGSVVRLSGDEGHHAVTVRRLTAGEPVTLVDGEGRRVEAMVTTLVDRRTLDAQAIAVVDDPDPDLRITVVQALAKGERGELAVEQLTEIGVDVIIPWSAANSVVQWRGDRVQRARRRWADAAFAAAKQSRRSRFPLIGKLAGTATVIGLIGAVDVAIVLHESAVIALASVALPASGEVVVVVGPEGGISADELDAFASAGAVIARLGPTVLRTSSAGMAAVAVLLAPTTRWSGTSTMPGMEG